MSPLDTESGRIELIIGPVCAGKTTELHRRYTKYDKTKKKCVYVKHPQITHSEATVNYIISDKLENVDLDVNAADIVCIDKGEFFPKLAKYCDKWAEQGKIVIVAALSGDHKQKPFPEVAKLIPLSEKMDILSAICVKCYNAEAFFTESVYYDVFDFENNGGARSFLEKYEPVCRGCRQQS